MTTAQPRVRPAQAADEAAVIALLVRARQWTGDPDRLRPLFRYEWDAAVPNRGFVVEVEGCVVGFCGAIYSDRQRRDHTERICSFSFYWVDPEHRSASLRLLQAALTQPGFTFTSLSPNANSRAILRRLGFREASAGYRLCLPFPGWPLPRGMRLLHRPEDLLPLLDTADERLVRSHIPYGCGVHLLSAGARQSLIITKPRRLERAPLRVSEVLYLSDPGLTLAHWHRAAWRIARRDRSSALALDEGLLQGEKPPRGLFRARSRLYRRPDRSEGPIDALYSELLFLVD